MTQSEKYRNLGGESPKVRHAKETLPLPSERDYQRGLIKRYFVKRIGETKIIEVDVENYNTISSMFYTKHSIDWQIAGQLNSSYVNGVEQRVGASDKNQKSVKQANDIFIGMSDKLKNPSQFFKTS